MQILVIDVGGTNIKVIATGQKESIKIPSGSSMTARKMAAAVLKATDGWKYEAVSIGFPGPVLNNRPLAEPFNLGKGWTQFEFTETFKCPVKIVNDATMQALGSYEGGRMLFLGLGTGLGSALILDGTLAPLELAHLPYKHGKTFEDFVGRRGLEQLGKKRWREHVADVSGKLQAALIAHYVVLGGGNAKLLKKLPEGARLGDNANAFRGGFRLWEGVPSGKTSSIAT